MKKSFIACLTLICLLFVSTSTSALNVSQDISAFVVGHKNTAEVTCVTFGSVCVLGIRTRGIILKSEHQKYILEVEQGVKEIAKDISKVVITTKIDQILIVKNVKKRLDKGESPMSIYNDLLKKYPGLLNELLRENV